MKNCLIQLFALILACTTSFAEITPENKNNITGIWLGKLKVSEKLELQLGFVITSNEDGVFAATMNVIEQKAFDIPMDVVNFRNDSLLIKMTEAGISYSGIFNSKNNSILGIYQQGEAKLELNLHEVEKLPDGKVTRPQTPVRPFPYNENEVLFCNSEAKINLSGTITMPHGSGKFPAIVLISGSGHNDRNGTHLGHFLLLSDYLTRKGYAVLRYDKRGVGSSEGEYDKATTYDFADDVSSAIDYLKQRNDIDTSKIGLIGHSEGALIAPMVAVNRNDIAYVVMMGAVGMNVDKLIELQIEKMMRAQSVPESEIINTVNLQKKYHNLVKAEIDIEQKREKIKEINPEIQEGTLGYLLTPWYENFIKISPDEYFKKLECSALAISGELDLQCPPDENMRMIEESLKKSKSNDYTLKVVDNVNHLFQTAKSGLPVEYENIAEIIAPKVLDYVYNWIQQKGR